ncbi:hypothetical protein [Terriglobus roseus]|uniref:Translation initiation factor IF-2 n=1 Tax=Terriglobus roseus TaxID=392734 RepID=A0A1H4QQY2_9BACT|nr:hypothetical protein [Terriglobus roseus]SEC21952.1 hypothetical protein SAMN05443244_2939 [Terriglobus roseus]
MNQWLRKSGRFVLPFFVAAALLFVAAPAAQAQVSFGVQIGNGGVAPECPYGYYDYAPYNCSPYGYYGPEWFNNGIFFGAGPWYRGPGGFHGYVNRNYDPRFGYRGGFPGRGQAGYYHGGDIHGFRGNQYRTGNGEFRGGGNFNRGGQGFRGGNPGGGNNFRGGGNPGGGQHFGGGSPGGGGQHGGGGGGQHGGGGGHR